MAKKKSRTAAANAARRKQGPTKRTDYKNGRPITAAAKKKAKRTSSGSGKRTGRRQSSNPGGSSSSVRTAKGGARMTNAKRKSMQATASQHRAETIKKNQKRKAGEAFKKKYKEVTSELKDMGVSSKQWDKAAIRRHAQAAAIKGSKRGGERMVKAYAKGVQKKVMGKGWVGSKAAHGNFYKGYRRALKQDFGV